MVWPQRAVGEGVKSCPRAGWGVRSLTPGCRNGDQSRVSATSTPVVRRREPDVSNAYQLLLQGLSNRMPRTSKSETLRVTSVKLCRSAVARMKASIVPTGRPRASPRAMTRRHLSAVSASTDKTRASKRAGTCWLSHVSNPVSSRAFRFRGAVRLA